jgi:hypothetical protein
MKPVKMTPHQRRMVERLFKAGEIVPRSAIESTAAVMGDHSAAAKALRDADSHDGEVRFWVVKDDNVIVVEKR